MVTTPDKQLLLLEQNSAVHRRSGKPRSSARACYNFILWLVVIFAGIFVLFALLDLCRMTYRPYPMLDQRGGGSSTGYSFTSIGFYFMKDQQEKRENEVTRGNLQNRQSPPFFWEKAKTARYIVHNSNWGAITTISVDLHGTPFGTVESFCDGPVDNSTGIPYFYLDPRNPTTVDSQANPAASLILSELESGYCQSHHWDPEDPRCARVCLSGKIIELASDTKEGVFAKKALFSRHPQMKKWPSGHGWKLLKLNVTHIWLLDFFGPASTVSVDDYFKIKM